MVEEQVLHHSKLYHGQDTFVKVFWLLYIFLYRAWDPPGGVPSSRWLPSSLPPHLTVLSQSSYSAHLPGASALLLRLTSVRRAGDQSEADFSAGRQPDRRNRRPSHPVVARPPRPGRDARGLWGGAPLGWIPQPRHGRQRV